jgi:uncharacterized protein YueI
MSSANLLVLNMLGQGRINADEAELLLLGLSERVIGAVGDSVTKKARRGDRVYLPAALPTYFSELQPAWI